MEINPKMEFLVIFSPRMITENIALNMSNTPSAIGVTMDELYFSNK